MNKVIISGRLTSDPKITYGQGTSQSCVARYTLAVERRFKKEGQQTADFISCVGFGKMGEFAEKYLHKGIKIIITGRIQTGSYTNKDGQRVYTTDIVVEDHEFCESKSSSQQSINEPASEEQEKLKVDSDGFMKIDDSINEEDLPFR